MQMNPKYPANVFILVSFRLFIIQYIIKTIKIMLQFLYFLLI